MIFHPPNPHIGQYHYIWYHSRICGLRAFRAVLHELVVHSFSPLLCLKYLTQRPDSPYKSLPWALKCLILDNCNIYHAEDVWKLVEDEAGMFFIVCVVILTDISAARMQAYLSSSVLARFEPHRTGLFQHQKLFETLLARANLCCYGTCMSEYQFWEGMGLFLCIWLCCIVL